MTTSNVERFIAAFNRIERTLREIVEAKAFMPFYRLLNEAKKKNPLVRKYEDELRVYADLRNVILHNWVSVEHVIAEPYIAVVEKIEMIDEALAKPKTVGNLFRKQVRTFQMDDSLASTLKVIHKRKYTQFPVYEGRQFKGLVTTVGITNWLAKSMQGQYLPKHVPTLRDILHHEKGEVNYRFIGRHMTVYEAEEIFENNIGRGCRIEALLVTEHGRPHQKLIGIVTPMDMLTID